MTSRRGAELAANWRLLSGCLLGVATSIASLFFYTNGIFIEQFIHEFGWTRGAAGSSATY